MILLVTILKRHLGPTPSPPTLLGLFFCDQEDAQDGVDNVLNHSNIRTDGGREPIPHLDVEVAGAGALVHSPAIIFENDRWGHAQDLDG